MADVGVDPLHTHAAPAAEPDPGAPLQPLPVPGYTPQHQEKISVVADHKQLEERLLRQLDFVGISGRLAADKRWLALARTHFEQGFMALNRAVFKPERIRLPEDPDPEPDEPETTEASD